jgi:DNA-binding transcriptional MerR regulator
MKKEWTLRELAAETGVPERTIRFYISRGLVDPPLRGGRGAAYGAGHKARLEAIKKLQAKGMMLAEIAHAIALANSGHVLRGEGDAVADIGVVGRYIHGAKSDVELHDVAGEAEVGSTKKMKSREIREDVLPLWITGAQAPGSAQDLASAPAPAPALPEPAVWRSYQVSDDVMVMVRAEAAPWRTKRILSALRQFSVLIGRESAGRGTHEADETPDTRDKSVTSGTHDDRDEPEKSIKGIKNDKDDKENQGE